VIGVIVQEEKEGGYIWEKNTMIFLELDFEKGWVIIKNVLINFLD